MNKAQIDNLKNLLDLWLPMKIKCENIPGLAVGVIDHGKVIYSGAFGFADLESRRKVKFTTNFRIASISKTFTAEAIWGLIAKRKIGLNDEITKYLPELPSHFSKITVKNLLQHTSGLVRDGGTHWDSDRFPTTKSFVKILNNSRPVYRTGLKFKYSNFATSILGLIIQQVTKKNFVKYVSEQVIEKQKLKNTFADYNSGDLDLAKGYCPIVVGHTRSAVKACKTNAFAPATGFSSNVPDLLKFISGFPKYILLARKNLVETGIPDSYYGLGFEFYKRGKRLLMGHSGGFFGFRTNVAWDNASKLGIVTLCNTNYPIRKLNSAIFALVDALQGMKKNDSSLSKFAGVYRSRWKNMVVSEFGDRLIAFDPKLHDPMADYVYFARGRDGLLRIEDKDGFGSSGEVVKFVGRKLFMGTNRFERI